MPITSEQRTAIKDALDTTVEELTTHLSEDELTAVLDDIYADEGYDGALPRNIQGVLLTKTETRAAIEPKLIVIANYYHCAQSISHVLTGIGIDTTNERTRLQYQATVSATIGTTATDLYFNRDMPAVAASVEILPRASTADTAPSPSHTEPRTEYTTEENSAFATMVSSRILPTAPPIEEYSATTHAEPSTAPFTARELLAQAKDNSEDAAAELIMTHELRGQLSSAEILLLLKKHTKLAEHYVRGLLDISTHEMYQRPDLNLAHFAYMLTRVQHFPFLNENEIRLYFLQNLLDEPCRDILTPDDWNNVFQGNKKLVADLVVNTKPAIWEPMDTEILTHAIITIEIAKTESFTTNHGNRSSNSARANTILFSLLEAPGRKHDISSILKGIHTRYSTLRSFAERLNRYTLKQIDLHLVAKYNSAALYSLIGPWVHQPYYHGWGSPLQFESNTEEARLQNIVRHLCEHHMAECPKSLFLDLLKFAPNEVVVTLAMNRASHSKFGTLKSQLTGLIKTRGLATDMIEVAATNKRLSLPPSLLMQFFAYPEYFGINQFSTFEKLVKLVIDATDSIKLQLETDCANWAGYVSHKSADQQRSNSQSWSTCWGAEAAFIIAMGVTSLNRDKRPETELKRIKKHLLQRHESSAEILQRIERLLQNKYHLSYRPSWFPEGMGEERR